MRLQNFDFIRYIYVLIVNMVLLYLNIVDIVVKTYKYILVEHCMWKLEFLENHHKTFEEFQMWP